MICCEIIVDITYSFENFHNLILKKINLIASMLVNSSVISLLIIVRRVIKTTFLKYKKIKKKNRSFGDEWFKSWNSI